MTATPNLALGFAQRIVATTDVLIGAPLNGSPGKAFVLVICQDSSGGHVITFDGIYLGVDFSLLSSAANSITRIDGLVLQDGTVLLTVSPQKASAPVLVGSYTAAFLANAGNTWTQGKFCYVTSDYGSFDIFDISGRVPVYVGGVVDVTNLAVAEGVIVVGRYAYVAVMGTVPGVTSSHCSLTVIDCINPASPTIAYTLHAYVNGSGIAILDHPALMSVSGNTLFVACDNAISASAQVCALDISVPTAPVVIGYICSSLLYGAIVTRVQGDVLYMTCRTPSYGVLAAIDITNPAAWSSSSILGTLGNGSGPFVGGFGGGSWVTGLAVRGKWCYVAATTQSTLFPVDVSDPAAMVVGTPLVDAVSFSGISNIHIAGNVLYTSSYGTYAGGPNPSGLAVVSVDDPSTPVVLAFVQAPSGAALDHIDISGNRLHVSAYWTNSGLYVYDIGGMTAVSARIGRLQCDGLDVTGEVRINGALIASSGVSSKAVGGGSAPSSVILQMNVMVLAGNYFRYTVTGGASIVTLANWYGTFYGTQGVGTLPPSTSVLAATQTFAILTFNLPLGSTVTMYTDSSNPPTTPVGSIAY